MSYVKKYDVGQIKLDLPYANYIHELPLLSFGDVQHTINLSLVYNRNNNAENAFHIANGFKLNLQKRLIVDGNTISYQDENGKIIALTQYGDVYTFQDDSQRILRRTEQVPSIILPPNPGSGIIEVPPVTLYDYEVEYPDFSKEKYNNRGNITTVCDKYSNTILSYTYRDDDRLTGISYRGSKNIVLSYSTYNKLKSITYAGCINEFNYNDNDAGMLNNIENSGVEYEFTLSGINFTINATATENNTIVSYSKELKLDTDEKTIVVSDKIGSNTVNTISYRYPLNLLYNTPPFAYVDIIDNNGVKTRNQYLNDKMLYSYEITDDVLFTGDKFAGNVHIHKTLDDLKNAQAAGIQTINDGINMSLENSHSKRWACGATNNSRIKGYYMVTGWAKINRDVANYQENWICISKNSFDGQDEIVFTVDAKPTKEWRFFAYKFHMDDAAIIYVYPKISDALELKDVRLTYQVTHIWNEEYNSHISMSENVLIRGDDTISFNDARFFYSVNYSNIEIASDDYTDRIVTLSDVMRYKLRKKKQGVYNEVYYNNCKNVITGATDLKVLHNGSYVSISNFDIGVKVYSNQKISLTRINVNEGNQSSDIVKTYTVGEDLVSTERLNNKLDIKETTSEGVKVSYQYDYDTAGYQSTGRGLIFKQTTEPITDADDTNTIVQQYTYDTVLTMLESSVDEFGNTTEYATDDAWGVVTAITLPDETIITDSYDDDKCVLSSRTFANVTNPRKTTFNYAGGVLDSLVHGNTTDNITFGFEYDEGELASVTKTPQNAEVEHHTYTETNGETTVESKYPSENGALHTETKLYDKYGRLKSVDGVLSNVYDLNPFWYYFDGSGKDHKTMEGYDKTQHGELIHSSPTTDNKDALLAETTDSVINETTKYGYDNGKLTAAVTYNNSDSVLRQETFVYDGIGRVTKDKFTYEITNPQTVETEIGYATDTDSPVADGRVKTYIYKQNGFQKAFTTNGYDVYKRINQKDYKFGKGFFYKDIQYDRTRPSKVVDSKGLRNNPNILCETDYEYDSMGRINSISNGNPITYEYDIYGQLVRENNKILDKSFQYVYNNIGNIESVKTYAYTPKGTALSGTPTKTESFTYSVDKLTAVNGSSLTYDANGCLKTRQLPGSNIVYNYTWDRGKLSSMYYLITPLDRTTYNYTYDAYGRRTAKNQSVVSMSGGTPTNITVNTTYDYDLNGRLIREKVLSCYVIGNFITTEKLFLYDESGVIGMIYTNNGTSTSYYFQRNIQGDVVAIYDVNGNKVTEYAYDAFGNCTILSTTNTTIANANPFRYRGYYFDQETGFYYLNSRYYSPEWRRFISPDDTAFLDPETPNGLNLYCYCGNDPVNYADPSGHEAKWLAWLISGVFITAGIVACAVAAPGVFGLGIIGGVSIGMGAGSLINGYVTEANGGSFWGGYIGGAISGALCGVGAGFGGLAFAAAANSVGLSCLGYLSLGYLASFAGGFVGNFTGTLYTDWHNSGFNGINLHMSELLATSTVMGTLNIFAGIGSGISSIIGEMGKVAGISVNSQFAHRLLAGTVAGGTEALYDITSYLYGFLN